MIFHNMRILLVIIYNDLLHLNIKIEKSNCLWMYMFYYFSISICQYINQIIIPLGIDSKYIYYLYYLYSMIILYPNPTSMVFIKMNMIYWEVRTSDLYQQSGNVSIRGTWNLVFPKGLWFYFKTKLWYIYKNHGYPEGK